MQGSDVNSPKSGYVNQHLDVLVDKWLGSMGYNLLINGNIAKYYDQQYEPQLMAQCAFIAV